VSDVAAIGLYFLVLEAFTRAAALADDFDLLGVACAVVADQLETALLGTARSTTVGTAVAAAHGIPHRFRRPAAVLHVIVAVLLLAASGRCENQKKRNSVISTKMEGKGSRAMQMRIIPESQNFPPHPG